MPLSSPSPKRAEALSYIKWFAQPEVQKKWWALGGYSAHNAVLKDPGYGFAEAVDLLDDPPEDDYPSEPDTDDEGSIE